MPSIAENIHAVRERIARAALRAGRDPNGVELVAVTKNADMSQVREALAAGVASLGESRVQQAKERFAEIGQTALWHLIGPLQTNKAKYCPGLFSLVHSADRMELLTELSRRAEPMGAPVKCLLQVNLSGEKQKSGCRREDAGKIIKSAALLGGVKIMGLMTVPPLSEDPEDSRPYFKELVRLSRELADLGVDNVEMNLISAGMTGDFETAVEEGANIVRIGSAIFR